MCQQKYCRTKIPTVKPTDVLGDILTGMPTVKDTDEESVDKPSPNEGRPIATVIGRKTVQPLMSTQVTPPAWTSWPYIGIPCRPECQRWLPSEVST